MTLENLANKLTKFLKSGYVIIDHRNFQISPNSIISIENDCILIDNSEKREGFFIENLHQFKICKKFVNLI